jgi:Family of unknown function (DUF5677)
MEILFLATNEYGTGALKLFRGLYERALALAYLVQYPDKVDRFINYGAIQEHRVLDAAFKSGISEEQWDAAMPDIRASMPGRCSAILACDVQLPHT